MSTLRSLFNQDDVDKHGVDAEIGNAKVLGVSSSTKDDDIREELHIRDYYSDSQRRKKSLERSNSMRKKNFARIVVEVEEGRKVVVMNIAKEVSPPTSSDQIVQKDNWRDSNSNSLREDYSGSLESVAFKDSASICGGIGIERKGSKKSQLK
ncbi:hypothetical protein Scep_020121 [Stephania cephalantha]|uniref:Uncharacterized protein n=1 Tax=Stephania cephalantha TaxID=152367 RepID=A0AAP0ICB0_9MAGN